MKNFFAGVGLATVVGWAYKTFESAQLLIDLITGRDDVT